MDRRTLTATATTSARVSAPGAHLDRAPAMLLAAEISLCGLTGAASFGLIRLFADGSFVPQVLAVTIAAHVLASVCRRHGVSSAITAVIAGLALLFVIPWLVLPHTTMFGIPTGETLRIGRQQIHDAWSTFGHVKAPTPTLPGFVLTAAIGTWGLAFLADTAAFRAGGLVEAMVPASTLFIFGAALGAPRSRVLCTAVYIVALLAFWLSARAYRQLSAPSWMTRDDGRGARAIVRTGAAVGAVGVLAAVVIGPRLPGADAKPIIPWRATDRESGASRVTVSPLVDIRTRIVDQAGIEVFQVKSPVRSYWRLTALEGFDGRIWSSNRKYRRADGTLRSNANVGSAQTDIVGQRFAISNLDSIWLPAAFRPVAIDGTAARYDAESGSLLTEAPNAIGATYDVTSAIPKLDGAGLGAATGPIPPEVATTYLALPPGFPPNVSALAASVIRGATTPYAAAKKLQDFFRSGAFTYDLDVPPGHGDDALQRFLFQTRRGYCEQFAGAYAAMARAAGIPSRVAVGFTTGDLTPDGTYSVRGYHGHAWPEVFLSGFGWVAFEPTPGRGIPGGEAYTGVPEAQAAPGAPNTATTFATPSTTATDAVGGPSTTVPDQQPGARHAKPTDATGPGNPWPRRLIVAIIVFGLVPLTWAAGVTVIARLRRWRRRAAAVSERERVVVAWDEVGEALARSGVPARRSETPSEFAERASRATKLDPRMLDGLAGLTTAARYAPATEAILDGATLEEAIAVARDIERTLDGRRDRRTKIMAAMDPRATARRA